MQSANFNGSCKNDNFQWKFLFCVSYFCSEHRLWTHVRAKIRQMCTPVKPSCTGYINMGCKGSKSLHRRVTMLK